MRTILITGGSDGLGKLVAEKLRDAGERVICLSRKTPQEGIIHIPCDLADDTSIALACEKILADYGNFDVIINGAGVFVSDPIDAMDAKSLEHCFRINTIAPMLLVS